MKNALFIDFEDSFSFNVIQELSDVGLQVDVMKWTDFTTATAHELLVLGPGPGHPDDYQIIYPVVQAWLKAGKKIFGVCLGHQILWRLLGLEVVKSSHPVHGQKILLKLTPSWQKWLELPEETWVQRYNSLAVMDGAGAEGMENLVMEGEIMMSRSSQIISYQFHPESVGTKCRASFFRPILRDLL